MIASILWHALLITFFILFSRQAVTNRLTGYLVSLLFLSVSLFAWQIRNPFNGLVFLVAGLLLIIVTRRQKNFSVVLNKNVWFKTAGILVFLSGFVYPHFLSNDVWVHLVVAPIGLIPCPTLLIVTGLALIIDLKQPRLFLTLLIVLDAFYGLFGVFKLEVSLDGILIVSALVLLLQTFVFTKPSKKQKRSIPAKMMSTTEGG
jgi:hypothetical protein